jgi:hypothetical protein
MLVGAGRGVGRPQLPSSSLRLSKCCSNSVHS